jgi:hypothetical protein
MSSCTLFVANLASDQTTDEDLKEIFGVHGTVVHVRIRKGFGFLTFETPAQARAAKEAEQGRYIGGKPIDIEWGRGKGTPKKDRTPYARANSREKNALPVSASQPSPVKIFFYGTMRPFPSDSADASISEYVRKLELIIAAGLGIHLTVSLIEPSAVTDIPALCLSMVRLCVSSSHLDKGSEVRPLCPAGTRYPKPSRSPGLPR